MTRVPKPSAKADAALLATTQLQVPDAMAGQRLCVWCRVRPVPPDARLLDECDVCVAAG
jgi:hypothetical protein